MNNSKSHAERELELLKKTTPDAIIIPFEKEIIALCEAFSESGQSGGSAPFTASAISQAVKKLMMFETLAPLTGEDDEWTDISDINEGEEHIMKYQNKRNSGVFKQSDGKAYFIDAIVFDGNIGGTFTSNCVKNGDEEIGSCQYIKSFPFTPKTFYIDVLEKRYKDKDEKILDENGDWWSSEIKDKSQLKEVFEYYEQKNI